MNSPRPLSRRDLIFMDYFALGLSARGHPMEHLRSKLAGAGVVGSRDFPQLKHRESVLVAGLVTVRQRPESAGGTIFLLLEDEHGFMNVIVPSKLVDEFAEPVKFATFIMVRGRFERDGAVMNVVGEKFRELKVRGLAHQSHDFH
jgi:error-prone DNA polymerase